MKHISCKCGEVLIKSMGDVVKFRTKTLVFKGDQAYLVCKGCGAEVPAPLILNKSRLKVDTPSLVVVQNRKIS